MKRKPTYDEMLVRMAGLCAGAEQCSADIRSKILKQGFSAEDAERMVGYLRQNRYLDDSRYARAYAIDKVRFSGWGRMKVRLGLRAKGIGDAAVGEALAYIPEEDYIASLRKTLAAKARALDLRDVKDRQKLYRHAAGRGFESNLIIAEIRSMVRESDDEVKEEEEGGR